MATTNDILIDAFGRVRTAVHDVLADLGRDELSERPAPDANPIGWIVWHLTRVQDDHLSSACGAEQAWTADGWCERFVLPYPAEATGYGQNVGETGAVRVPGDLLAAYHDAVCARTCDFLATLGAEDFDRVVDSSWDPPVTLGVRIVSVLDDDLEHAGQAAYVKGLLVRRASAPPTL